MRSKITGLLAACLLLASSVTGCTLQTVVHTPPPAEREETPGAAPSAQHFWVRGNWQWDGHDYHWATGHWEVRRTNASWKSGHWRNVSGGWVWIEGRWAEH